MKKTIDFTLILPCFNEMEVFDESVRFIIDALSISNLSFEIIFVDDGSTDRTRQRIRKICKVNRFCRYVFHKHNMGRGAAVVSGIQRSKARVVGYMDIDCEVSPIYMPYLVSLVYNNSGDVIIGERIYTVSVRTLFRSVASRVYRALVSCLFHIQRMDAESGYKVFNKQKFLPILHLIRNKHWFWDTESIVYSMRNGLRVLQVPVLFLRRTDKKSSVHVFHDLKDYIKNIWMLYWHVKKSV